MTMMNSRISINSDEHSSVAMASADLNPADLNPADLNPADRYAANQEPALHDVLSDPIIHRRMASDGLQREHVESVLRVVQSRLFPVA